MPCPLGLKNEFQSKAHDIRLVNKTLLAKYNEIFTQQISRFTFNILERKLLNLNLEETEL